MGLFTLNAGGYAPNGATGKPCKGNYPAITLPRLDLAIPPGGNGGGAVPKAEANTEA